jgi:hypothetical protein
MASAELSAIRPHAHAGDGVRAAMACTTALIAVTAIATIAGTVDHALAPSAPPHPTLHPTLAAAASILANNARVLTLPYGLVILRFDTIAWGRSLGSGLLVGVLGANAVTVGLALGRWQGRLVPYLPHLPLEWAAAGLAASVWARALATGPRDPGHVAAGAGWRGRAVAAAMTLTLLAGAAGAEALLTPHAA